MAAYNNSLVNSVEQQIQDDLDRALMLAGILETYIQFMEMANPDLEEDNATLRDLRKAITPAIQELRDIRLRAAQGG